MGTVKPCTMGVEPHDELMASLSDAHSQGTYSDLTIISGSNTYKVHKVLVCGRSLFFQKACNGFFKEGITDTITLPDDDPQAVKLMVHYLYHLDYPHQPDIKYGFLQNSQDAEFTFGIDADITTGVLSKKEAKKKKSSKTLLPLNNIHKSSNLVIHARVYALGEKYGIEGLKLLSLEKFKQEAEFHWDSDDFVRPAEEAYSSTLDQDRGLRDAVADVFTRHPRILDSERVQTVVRELDLCFELMMRFR